MRRYQNKLKVHSSLGEWTLKNGHKIAFDWWWLIQNISKPREAELEQFTSADWIKCSTQHSKKISEYEETQQQSKYELV